MLEVWEMLDSFLLFIDPKIKEWYKPTDPANLGSRLQDLGYRVIKTTDEAAVEAFSHQVDALIICTTVTEVDQWANKCLVHRSLPFTV
jgi:two-component system, response regulator / RNA-binding antiterminator